MPAVLLALGALATVGGLVTLASAARLARRGDAAGERRRFRAGVAALAVGSILLVVATVARGAAG